MLGAAGRSLASMPLLALNLPNASRYPDAAAPGPGRDGSARIAARIFRRKPVFAVWPGAERSSMAALSRGGVSPVMRQSESEACAASCLVCAISRACFSSCRRPQTLGQGRAPDRARAEAIHRGRRTDAGEARWLVFRSRRWSCPDLRSPPHRPCARRIRDEAHRYSRRRFIRRWLGTVAVKILVAGHSPQKIRLSAAVRSIFHPAPMRCARLPPRSWPRPLRNAPIAQILRVSVCMPM